MISLQFSRQADLCSDSIAWFSAGHLSHVDAIGPDGLLWGSRSDKTPKAGVQKRPSNYARFATRVIIDIPASPILTGQFYDWLDTQMGKPYDKTAIWGFLVNRDWREPDSWFCSELQAAGLERVRLFPKLYLAANKITPVALALACSTIPGRKIYQLT